MLLFCAGFDVLPAIAADPQVPEGFTVEKVAGEPLLQRPIFACLDDDGRLFVGESSGENLTRPKMLAQTPHWISRLEDTDGDGRFDRSTKFVKHITLPQGCLWYQGSLYAACPPSIWKFTDTDGDGVADERREILTGFGFSGNACDTHGPFLSPSGRLYIVQGRHGHQFRDQSGNVFSSGQAGRVYSCTPDGEDVRVHAGGGFDNPVEVDFTDSGECIGTANIVFRDRGDCLLHWVEGGVYPREDQADAVAEFKWTGGLLGPVHNLGHVAVSGITRVRGPQFGNGTEDRWFFTEFNTHKVRFADLKRTGATFSAEVHEFLNCADGDFHPTDVLEDAGGSLLVLNTGGWFLNGCPTSRIARPEIYGGVYRIAKNNAPKIADPRGQQLPPLTANDATFPTLVERLEDPRPEVREKTIREIRSRPELQEIALAHLQPGDSQEADAWKRLNPRQLSTAAYAGLLRATGSDAQSNLLIASRLQALGDFNRFSEEQRADATEWATITLQHAAELVWTEPLDANVSRTLLPALLTAPPQVFLSGMELAATRCSDRVSPVLPIEDAVLKAFVERAAETSLDRVSEHALIYALIRQNRPAALTVCLTSSNPRAQRAALIAFDQLDHSPLTQAMVQPLLASPDVALQQTALEVIACRPGWGAETLATLIVWLREERLSVERASAITGFLQAQLKDPAVQSFLIETLSNPQTSDAVRVLLWESLQRSTITKLPDALTPQIKQALLSSKESACLSALKIIQQRSLPAFDADLMSLAQDRQRPFSIRCEAIAALGKSATPLDEGLFQELMSALIGDQRTSEEQALISRALAASSLSDSKLQQLAALLPKTGPLTMPGLMKAFARSTNEQTGLSLVAALMKSEAVVSVSPDELAGVLRKYPESVRTAARPLLARLGVDAAAQEARLAELTMLLQEGNPVAGRDVFFGRKAACSSCHAIDNQGGRIGPHLTTIGASRSPHDLLEAIVFPSASFVNGYRPTLVVTSAGQVLQGVISSETTETITLRTQDLRELQLARSEIEEQREASASIMPAGLDRQLTPDELRDLLAYLQSRK